MQSFGRGAQWSLVSFIILPYYIKEAGPTLAQWLERTANNRKVPGSNPGSAPSPFLFTWGPSITICAGSVRCLAGAARRVVRDQLRIVGHDRVHWQCEVLGW